MVRFAHACPWYTHGSEHNDSLESQITKMQLSLLISDLWISLNTAKEALWWKSFFQQMQPKEENKH